MTARFPVRGVFPRLLAGHRRRADGAILALVHSHHDGLTDEPMVPVPPDGPDRPMFISIPTSSHPPWTTRVIAYPTTRLAPYRVQMHASIARVLKSDPSLIAILRAGMKPQRPSQSRSPNTISQTAME